jgi:hypothetical protein
MKKLLMTLALLVFSALPAAAQPEPSAGEAAAVRDLLEASRTRENFIKAMELGMEQGGMGELTPGVRQVLREFMEENFRYEDLEPEFIRVYAQAFTEQELRDLAAFYRTSLGQRVVETLPEITAASQRIAMERMQTLMPQLMQAVMEAMQAEEQGSGTPKS